MGGSWTQQQHNNSIHRRGLEKDAGAHSPVNPEFQVSTGPHFLPLSLNYGTGEQGGEGRSGRQAGRTKTALTEKERKKRKENNRDQDHRRLNEDISRLGCWMQRVAWSRPALGNFAKKDISSLPVYPSEVSNECPTTLATFLTLLLLLLRLFSSLVFFFFFSSSSLLLSSPLLAFLSLSLSPSRPNRAQARLSRIFCLFGGLLRLFSRVQLNQSVFLQHRII